MVPGFNPKEWDRDKIIEWVMDDGPLTDQQIEFLMYFGKLQNENKQMKKRLDGIDKVISHWLKPLRHDASFRSNPVYTLEMMELQNIAKGYRDEEILKAFGDNN